MIRHHPSEALLVADISGYLPEAHRHVVAAHLSICSTCRTHHRELLEVEGALLEAMPPSLIAEDALAQTLAKLDDSPPKPEAFSTLDVTQALESGRWRWSGPGIAMMNLLKRDDTTSRLDLIRVAPGVGLLEHGHTGFETTVVLQGAFVDEGTTYRVGDFASVDIDTDHSPRATGAEDCICLIAITGRLSGRGWLGRLLQPLFGL
jgi:putative transcriptional regulator